MHEHETKKESYISKIDIDQAGRLDESEMSYEDQRKLLEDILALQIPDLYADNTKFVTKDEHERDTLKLRVPFHDGTAPVTVGREVDPEGNSNTYLTFHGGWENNWKFEDGPRKRARLIPCTRDAETGEFTPKQPSEHYDPTTDREIGFWGNPWIKNLREGVVERPGVSGRVRSFGGAVLRTLNRIGSW